MYYTTMAVSMQYLLYYYEISKNAVLFIIYLIYFGSIYYDYDYHFPIVYILLEKGSLERERNELEGELEKHRKAAEMQAANGGTVPTVGSAAVDKLKDRFAKVP